MILEGRGVEEGFCVFGEFVAVNLVGHAVFENEQAKLSQIGDQNLIVMGEVFQDLRRSSELIHLGGEGFDLQSAARWLLAGYQGPGRALYLICGKEARFRDSSARILQVDRQTTLGFRCLPTALKRFASAG